MNHWAAALSLEGALAAGEVWLVPQANAEGQLQEASGYRSLRESAYFLEQADSSLEHKLQWTEGQTCAVCTNSWAPCSGSRAHDTTHSTQGTRPKL